MATFNIHQAKTCLSQLLARVEAGEEIVLARGSRPVAKLIRSLRSRPSGSSARYAGS